MGTKTIEGLIKPSKFEKQPKMAIAGEFRRSITILNSDSADDLLILAHPTI